MKSCKNQKVNLVFALLTALLLSLGAAMPVTAQGAPSLTVTYNAVDSAEFHLYRIGSIDENMQLDYLPAYVRYRSTLDLADTDALNALTSAQMTDAAAKIAKKVNKADAEITFSTSGKKGTVEDLPVGVYLLTGEDVTTKTHIYHALPMIVMVPQFVPSNGTYNYDASVEVKPSMEELPPSEPETKQYSVNKVWIGDEGYPRPTQITVEIYRGTTLWRTVTLSESNNWTYTWQGGVSETFNVAEKDVPVYYTVVQTGDTTNFVLNNYFSQSEYEAESERQRSRIDPDGDEEISETDKQKEKEDKKKSKSGTTTTTNQKTTTTTTTTTSKKSDGAKTADNSMPVLWLALMAGAMLLILVAARKKRTR
jgi:hypothetical protein